MYTVEDSQTGFGVHHGRKIMVSVSPTVLIRATLSVVTKVQTFSNFALWEFGVHVTVWRVTRSEGQLDSAQSSRFPSLGFQGGPA